MGVDIGESAAAVDEVNLPGVGVVRFNRDDAAGSVRMTATSVEPAAISVENQTPPQTQTETELENVQKLNKETKASVDFHADKQLQTSLENRYHSVVDIHEASRRTTTPAGNCIKQERQAAQAMPSNATTATSLRVMHGSQDGLSRWDGDLQAM